ncbi:MAG: diphthine--ammonia ligase [bacterium]
MITNNKALFAWSGGKDSAMALYVMKENSDFDIRALMTTVTEGYNRTSMHGVRVELLDRQVASIGIPLEKVYISKKSSNEEYEEKMAAILLRYKELGVSFVAFGDLFLEDLKKYREDNLAKVDVMGIFPIWKKDTAQTAQAFIDLGFKAIITCVDTNHLDGSFAGRAFDESFLSDLPESVDPCGENGEFHSFVFDGPIFKDKIIFEKGEVILRDGRYMFCDLIPVD